MITNETVEAQVRGPEHHGKNAARRLRRDGRIPATVYGAGEPVSVTVDPKQITKILVSESGHNTIFDLDVQGKKAKAMVADWQVDPIKSRLLHIDLKRIAMDKAMRVKVPVHLTGSAAGVKLQGGIMDQILREVEIECLPSDIPSSIEADVTEMVFGQVLRVSDLPHAGSIKFITDENQPVAHVTAVKEDVAATAETAETTTAEPEVIKKGKTEEEGAAAPAAGEKAKAPAGGDKGKK